MREVHIILNPENGKVSLKVKGAWSETDFVMTTSADLRMLLSATRLTLFVADEKQTMVTSNKTMKDRPTLFERYNALCSRPFVGLLMIPITILVCFSPVLLFALFSDHGHFAVPYAIQHFFNK